MDEKRHFEADKKRKGGRKGALPFHDSIDRLSGQARAVSANEDPKWKKNNGERNASRQMDIFRVLLLSGFRIIYTLTKENFTELWSLFSSANISKVNDLNKMGLLEPASRGGRFV